MRGERGRMGHGLFLTSCVLAPRPPVLPEMAVTSYAALSVALQVFFDKAQ